MKKTLITLTLSSLVLILTSCAYGERGRKRGNRPQLTTEQQACLEGILGKRGEGQRPTREQKRQAASECGLEKRSDTGQ